MEVAELARYGVVAAQVSFIAPFLGLEFSSYSHRQMLGDREENRGFYLSNSALFQLCSSLLVILVLFILWTLGLYSSQVSVVLIFGLIFLDNSAHELVKLHSTLRDPLRVALLGMWRYGSWVIPLLITFYLNPAMRSAETVLVFWAVGSLSATLYGLVKIDRTLLRKVSWKSIDQGWIRSGVKVCLLYLLIASLTRVFFTYDRILLDQSETKLVVASYIAFSSMAGAWRALMDSGVMVKRTPELIEAVRTGRSGEALTLSSKTIVFFLKSYPLGLLLITPVAYGFLILSGKLEYLEYFYLLPAIFIVQLVAQIAAVNHALLYALGGDRAIFVVHLLAVALFFLGAFLLMPVIGVLGLVLTLVAVYLLMAFQKRAIFESRVSSSAAIG